MIQLNLQSGTVTNTNNVTRHNLTTFLVFPYDPRYAQSTPVSWAIFKWYISFNNEPGQGVLDPFYFSNVTVNQGNAFNYDTRYLTAPVSGYYYMYLSCGAGVGLRPSTFNLAIMSGNDVILDITNESTAQKSTDMFTNSAVVYLSQGQQVRAVAATGSYLYSSIKQYEISWIGMLLYPSSAPSQ
jgi:hypothetical protein